MLIKFLAVPSVMLKAFLLGLLVATMFRFAFVALIISDEEELAILSTTTSMTPVNLSDRPVVARNQRSTPFHHLNFARKIQMFIKDKYLQLLPDGTINGTTNSSSIYTIFQRITLGIGIIKIKGVYSCQYICIDNCGILYSARRFDNECKFNESMKHHSYNTYSSVEYSNENQTIYLALNQHGQPRRVILKKNQNFGKLWSNVRVVTKLTPLGIFPSNLPNISSHSIRHNSYHCPKLVGSDGGESESVVTNASLIINATENPIMSSGTISISHCHKRRKRKKKKQKYSTDQTPLALLASTSSSSPFDSNNIKYTSFRNIESNKHSQKRNPSKSLSSISSKNNTECQRSQIASRSCKIVNNKEQKTNSKSKHDIFRLTTKGKRTIPSKSNKRSNKQNSNKNRAKQSRYYDINTATTVVPFTIPTDNLGFQDEPRYDLSTTWDWSESTTPFNESNNLAVHNTSSAAQND